MTEPIYQWSGFRYDSQGNRDQFVFRIYEAIPPAEYMQKLAEFNEQIVANGYSSGPQDEPNTGVPQQSAPAKQEFENNFEAGALVKNIVDGKTYFKVSGKAGQFPKFPVSIWPEVIERDLCPMDELTADSYPLEGYVAYYEKNEKGNPRKVIRLVKGAE